MRVEIPVTVPLPPVASVEFVTVPTKFYVGTNPKINVVVTDAVETRRDDVKVEFGTSDDTVGSVDDFGVLTLRQPGPIELMATAAAVSSSISIEVEANPVVSLDLQSNADSARTGDVVRFTARTKDARGLAVRGVPVTFAVGGETEA